MAGLTGEGYGEEITPGSLRAKKGPPLWGGVILYSAQWLSYAPVFPDGAVPCVEEGYCSNFLIRSLSQILGGDRGGDDGSRSWRRCASSRAALVYKYGRDPHA